MINRGVNALVVAPVDKTALTTSMENAKKKMPVVVFDSGSDFKDYNAFVATDNYKGGQLAGEQMVKLLEGKKDVELALVRYQAGSASTMDREKGFLDVVKKARPWLSCVSFSMNALRYDVASSMNVLILMPSRVRRRTSLNVALIV